jgi:succinate dehydrogenase / fumarate reductase cytochrome b subunit
MKCRIPHSRAKRSAAADCSRVGGVIAGLTGQLQEVFAMPTPRPISPHLGIYRWRINMVQSSLHRLTGLFLSIGAAVLTWGLIAAAAGHHAWQLFADFSGSWIGLVVWFAWIWALLFHLCNGIQHLLHSLTWDYGPQHARDRTRNPSYWATGWVVVGVSTALTVLTWVLLIIKLTGGAA